MEPPRHDQLTRLREAFGVGFYRQVLEALPGGLIYVARDGAVLEANAQAAAILGLSHDEITERFVSDWEPDTIYEDGRPCPVAEYPVTRCLITGQPQPPVTLGVRRPSGKIAWATFTAVPIGAGDSPEPLGAVVTFVDLTEIKRTEQALRASERQLRALAEHSPDHILTTDREGTILFVNRPAPELRIDEVVGKRLFDFVPPEQIPHYERVLTQVFEQNEPAQIEVTAEEIGRTYVNRLVPMLDSDGNVDRALVIATDVTDQRQADAERLELLARYQQAQRLESLGVLAGGVAHDFNNLLVGILGNLELALRNPETPNETRPLLEDAQTTASRAAEMTHQLLAYSGRGEVRRVVTDVNEVLREAPHLLGGRLSPRARLELDLAPDLEQTLVDQVQLRQVLLNLLTNASDALGPQGGAISVRTRSVAAEAMTRPLAVGEVTHERYLAIEVRDEGQGMTPEVKERIFEPFFSTRTTGQGLGLAAVLGLARGHDAALALDTAPGEGTTVRLYLPLVAPTGSEATPGDSGERAQPAEQEATVLVVDDEHHVRRVAQRVLEGQGYRVLLAADGAEGLRLYRQHQAEIQVVVLDMLMPGIAGDEVLKRLLEIDPDARVLLSSGCFEDLARRGVSGEADRRSSAVGLLPKPYHINELIEAVALALRAESGSSPAPRDVPS